mmetsp:Transcript_7808/g.17830  ORF Transcript_7808/g.17830 Transcript_7808/m.17830 type:complete len:621 (-) Transcript_7808:1319-3181(-)
MGGRREGDADGSKVHAESAQICTECEGDDGVSEKDKTCMGLENKYGAADCVSAQNGQMRIAGLQEEGDGDDAANGILHKHQQFQNRDYIRIIIQALEHLGCRQSAEMLERESGVRLRSEAVEELEQATLQGCWDKAESLLPQLELDDQKTLKCRLVIKRQKFLEMLRNEKIAEAMTCLRTEITPLTEDSKMLHSLACLILCKDESTLQKQARWLGANQAGRQDVLKQIEEELPPSAIIPPRRLDYLLQQALKYQMSQCLKYNRSEPWDNLLVDCHASDDLVPNETMYLLELHKDEVWHVQFSNNGKFLASASKDKTVIIWSVDEQFNVYKILKGHQQAVNIVAWNPDDRWLLSGGGDLTIKLWETRTGNLLREFKVHTESVSAIAWLNDEDRFVSGSYDKKLIVWNAKSEEPEKIITGERVTDLAVSKDGRRLVMISPEQRIRVYSLPHIAEASMATTMTFSEKGSMTSICVSHDGRYALVNVSSDDQYASNASPSEIQPEVHLWDLEEKKLIKRFRGHKQGRYVLRSSFGGNREVFVVGGSEDCRVFLWHRDSAVVIHALKGHSGTINSVAWNPKDAVMFASASDDNTIRVWGCRTKKAETKKEHMNGASAVTNGIIKT